MSNFKAGTTQLGMTELDAFELEGVNVDLLDPKPFFWPGAARRKAASGKTFYDGPPRAAWEWGFITADQRDALYSMWTPGEPTTTLFIRTRTNERETGSEQFKEYSCLATWPEETDEEISVGYRFPFRLEFTHLVELGD